MSNGKGQMQKDKKLYVLIIFLFLYIFQFKLLHLIFCLEHLHLKDKCAGFSGI